MISHTHTNAGSTFPFHTLTLPDESKPLGAIPGNTLRLIAGDASDRKFYRLDTAELKAICMRFPKWEGGYGGDPISWLGMHHALDAVGIPVPRVYAVDEQRACIWTEDFGDQFLNYRLRNDLLDETDPECTLTLGYYRQALDLLVHAQYPERPIPAHPALKLAFDKEKLLFEMRFFVTHFMKGFLKIESEQPDFNLEPLMADFERLCQTLDARERVLCHRDYHVRNVMIEDNHAKWIDFQDARMGPHTYDVVSLVRDSYVRITKATRENLYAYYFDQLNRTRQRQGLAAITLADYHTELLYMGMQRNIKAIGSFGYLATTKGKPGYLGYVNWTLETLTAPENTVSEKTNLWTEYPAVMSLLRSLREGELRRLMSRRMEEFLNR
jgi:aminoglycoside/choline kinase family phosphotransferase